MAIHDLCIHPLSPSFVAAGAEVSDEAAASQGAQDGCEGRRQGRTGREAILDSQLLCLSFCDISVVANGFIVVDLSLW